MFCVIINLYHVHLQAIRGQDEILVKALLLEEAGLDPKIVSRDLPIPILGTRDVLVKVKACGFCHHDVLVMSGVLRRGIDLPLVLGHEVAGEVAEVGSEVSTVSLGDRVVCLPSDSCGSCQECRRDREDRCTNKRGLGHGIHGGFAEYIKVRESTLLTLGPQIDWIHACLLACPIGVGLKAMDQAAQIKAGETVVITGAGGGLGVHILQATKERKAKVLAVTSSPKKVALLRDLGADQVLVRGELDFSEVVLALTEDRGADVVLDTGGPVLFPSTFRCLGRNGRYVALGEIAGMEVSLNLAELIFRSSSVIGSVGVTKMDTDKAIQLVTQNKLRPVISHVFPWKEILEARKLLQKGEVLGRIVLQPNNF